MNIKKFLILLLVGILVSLIILGIICISKGKEDYTNRLSQRNSSPSIKVLKGTILSGVSLTPMLGAIRIEGNIIKEVGVTVDMTNALVIDLGKQYICPGFINTHDHLNYNDLYPQTIPKNCKDDKPWVYDDRYRWQQPGEQQVKFTRPNGYSLNGQRAVEMYSSIRHILGGTTSIVGSLVGSPGLMRDLSVDCDPSSADPAAFANNANYCKKDANGKLYSPYSGFPIQVASFG